MRKKIITLIVLCLLLASQIQAFTLVNASTNEKDAQSVVLKAITRHDGTIYNKYETAFKAKYPEVSDIQWLEITNVNDWKSAIQSTDIDILWGGGPTIFTQLAEADLLAPMQDTDLINYINANVSETIAGANMILRDEVTDEYLWVAAAISSFGFTVNHENLEEYNLPMPETWEDLASSEYYLGSTQHAIGMGDAPETTSNTRVYQIILQKFGWEAGWDILTRMAGNAKIFEGGSGPTRDSVITGEQAVAMTIDFYGYQAMVQNPACEYVIPKNESIINADPIAIATSSDNQDLADKFANFVISAEGQSLWLDEAINRLPIVESAFHYAEENGYGRPDLYEAFNKSLSGAAIPFDEDLALEIYDVVTFYFQGSFTQASTELYSAWGSVVDAYEQGSISLEELRSISRDMSSPSITLEQAKTMQEDYIADPNLRDDYVSQFKDDAVSQYKTIASKVAAESSDSDDDGTYFDKFMVEILNPAADSIVSGTTTIEFETVDYGSWNFLYGVKNASLLVDGSVVETIYDEPWEIDWDTSGYADGSHTVTIKVFEGSGRSVQDEINLYVNVITDLPEITISNPAEDAELTGTVTIEASAAESEDYPLAFVILTIVGPEGTIMTENITTGFDSISVDWNTEEYDPGDYTITITSHFTTGNTKAKSITVSIAEREYTPSPGFEILSLLLATIALVGYGRIRKREDH